MLAKWRLCSLKPESSFISALSELLGKFVNLASLLETYGDHWILAIGGGLIGLLFGFSAQRSKFCARAAVIEGADGVWGPRFAGWLLAFASAILMVQAFTATGFLKTEGARHLGAQGSISGAILGGLMFGIGMIMTRGCASRLIILSANGNLNCFMIFLISVFSFSTNTLCFAAHGESGGASKSISKSFSLPLAR